MAEAVRHASVVWNGDLINGGGMITYVSSGIFSRLPVSWAARTGEHGGKTSPEELLAAAHASCFSMAFSARLGKNGASNIELNVRVDVTFEQGDPGWKVSTSKITVRGRADGIDQATFERLADDAKDNCPISQALKGNVDISVEATLEP